MDCGFGNIVKGVKKRKNPCDRRRQSDQCPGLRGDESLHTLLSKLDLVEKKLEKLDKSIGTSIGNRDDSSSKIKVKLPDQWLNAINSYQASGRQPVLEVSVETDCQDEDVRKATRSPCKDCNRTYKTTAETPTVIPKDAEPFRCQTIEDGFFKCHPASSTYYEDPVQPITEPDMSASNRSRGYGYSTEHLGNPVQKIATEPEMTASDRTFPWTPKPHRYVRQNSMPIQRPLSNLLSNGPSPGAPPSVPPSPDVVNSSLVRFSPSTETVLRKTIESSGKVGLTNPMPFCLVAVKTSPSGGRLLCQKYIPSTGKPDPIITPFICQFAKGGLFLCTRAVEEYDDFIPIASNAPCHRIPKNVTTEPIMSATKGDATTKRGVNVQTTESNPLANCFIPLLGKSSGSQLICAKLVPDSNPLTEEPNDPAVAPKSDGNLPKDRKLVPEMRERTKDRSYLERVCCNHCGNQVGKVTVDLDGTNNCGDSSRIPFVTKSSDGVTPCYAQDQKQGIRKDCKPTAGTKTPPAPAAKSKDDLRFEGLSRDLDRSTNVEALLAKMELLEKKYEKVEGWQEFLKYRAQNAGTKTPPVPAPMQQYPTTKTKDPFTPCFDSVPKVVGSPKKKCVEENRCESELPPSRPCTPYGEFYPKTTSTPKRCGEQNKYETEHSGPCAPCREPARKPDDFSTKRRRSCLDMDGLEHRSVPCQKSSSPPASRNTSSIKENCGSRDTNVSKPPGPCRKSLSPPASRNTSSIKGNIDSRENDESRENNEATDPGPRKKSLSPRATRNTSSINGNSRENNEAKPPEPLKISHSPPTSRNTSSIKETYESESINGSKRSERRKKRQTSLIPKKSSPVEDTRKSGEDDESQSSVIVETHDESDKPLSSERNKIYYAMELPTSEEKDSANDKFKFLKSKNELSDLIISEGQILTSQPSVDLTPYESLQETDTINRPMEESIHSPFHSDDSRSFNPVLKVIVHETQDETVFTNSLTCQSRSANPSITSKLSGHQEANTLAAAQSNVTNMQMEPVCKPAIESCGLEHPSNEAVSLAKDSFSKKELLSRLMDPSTVKVIDQIRNKTSKIDTVIRTEGKTMNSSQTTTLALRNLKTYSPVRSESNNVRTRSINVRTVTQRKYELGNLMKSRRGHFYSSNEDVSRIKSKCIKKGSGVKSGERSIDSSRGRRSIPASHRSLWTRVSDAERKRIHRLAHSLESSRRNRPSVSSSHEDKHELVKGNRTFQDPRKKSVQDSYLNEKYLKELIFPFASQEVDPPADHSQKNSKPRRIMFERVFRINRRTVREATNFTSMQEEEVDDKFESAGSSNTSRNPSRVEDSRDSKPGIFGSSNSGQPSRSNRSSESLSSPADHLRSGVTNMALFIEYLHDTLMEIDGSSDPISKDTGTQKASDAVKDLIFDRLSAYQDSTDSSGQNREYPNDSTTTNQSSREENYERNLDLETLLRDSIVNLLYRHFNRNLRCSDDGDESNASNVTKRAAVAELVSQDSIIKDYSRIRSENPILHQETKPVSEEHKNLLSYSSDYDPNQAYLTSSSNECLHDLTESSTDQDFSREKSWESVYHDPFACTSSPISYPSASTLNDSQFTEASREENDAGTLLRRASEIMDLLEIYPRPQRTESQLERTGLWIRNVQKGFHNKSERLKNEKIRTTKENGEKFKNGLSNTIIKFPKKKIISSSVLHRKHRIPKCPRNKSGNDYFDDSKEEKFSKQKLLVYMNDENRNFFKTECKYGCNRLPKTSPQWIRQVKPHELSANKDTSGGIGRTYKAVPMNYKIHSHLRSSGQHHHHDHSNKRKNVGDDLVGRSAISALEGNEGEKGKRFLVVNKRRLAKELGMIKSNSSSSPSTSESTLHKRKPGPQKVDVHTDDRRKRISFADDEDYKTSVGIHSHPEPHKTGNHGGTDRSEARNMKPKIKETDKKPYRNRSKRANIKLLTRAASRSEISVSSMEHSYHDTRRNSRYPRTRTVPYNMPRTVQPIAKRKEQNAPMNYRQRLITSDSKSSAGYDRVNVRDFIDFLSTLSRNTIGTLTNKKKALRLYKNYLTNPSRHR